MAQAICTKMGKGSQIILLGRLSIWSASYAIPREPLSFILHVCSAACLVSLHETVLAVHGHKRHVKGVIHFTCFRLQHRMNCTPEVSVSLLCLQKKTKQLTAVSICVAG